MSALRSIVLGCVSDRGPVPSHSRSEKRPTNAPYDRPRLTRVKFGVALADALKDDSLPGPLVEILVHLAREGVTTSDLFRRPGNAMDLKMIVKRLSEGREVQLGNYNFYTLASVIKKFLLKIPGGIFGPDVENQLLQVLEMDNRNKQHDFIHSVISTLPLAVQKLLSLLFGTWFRIVNHSEYNTMSSESVAKSVAGSLFHTCADDPVKVERAVYVLQILIDDFGVGKMFGHKNLQYFTEVTRTGINVHEKFRYELSLPEDKSLTELVVYIPLFLHVVDCDVVCRAFDASVCTITEEEFYSLQHHVTSSKPSPESSMAEAGNLRPSTASTPSPKSLQPNVSFAVTDPDYNPHKKLAHVSSLSAPEVNQGCVSPSTAMSPSPPHPNLSTSLSRFDSVRRRQLVRLRKRSHWFLSPTVNEPHDSRSALSSFEASGGGMSSLDPPSPDAATSDGTMSDCIPVSDGIRVSSDLDCAFDENAVLVRSTDPVSRRAQARHRVGNADENVIQTSSQQTPSTQTLHDLAHSSQGIKTNAAVDTGETAAPLQRRPSQVNQEATQGRTRCYLVENFYGLTADKAMQS